MAKFKITKKTTVSSLKKQFYEEIGAVLRIYDGRSEADEKATLVSLGAVEGEIECRTSRTVGKFIEAFKNDCNLKVKVYTKDNKVSVLDGVTLSTIKEMPNGVRKSDMDSFIGYRRDGVEDMDSAQKKDSLKNIKSISVNIPKGYKKIVEDIDLSYFLSDDRFEKVPSVDLKFKSIKLPEGRLDEVDVEKLLSSVMGEEELSFVFIRYGNDSYPLSCAIGWSSFSEAVSYIEEVFRSGKVEADDDVVIYASTYSFITHQDMEELESSISIALEEYMSGREGNMYWFDWDEDLTDKLLLRVEMDGRTDIFMAYSDGHIDLDYMTNKEFDNFFIYVQLYDNSVELRTFVYNGKVGIINNKGNVIFQPVFDVDLDIYEEISDEIYFSTPPYGMHEFSIDGKFGLVNLDKGTFVTEFKYEEITKCEDGTFKARLDGVEGIIDENGNFYPEKE